MAKDALFEKVEQIKPQFRILILVGTVAILVGLFIYFIYIPKTKEIADKKEKIEKLQQELQRAKVKARKEKETEAELASVNALFQDALKLLPNEKEIPKLLRTITKLGVDSNLEFRLFSPQKEKPQDFYMVIPVSIEVSGSYHNVAIFFDRVSQMERIVNIVDVSMNPVKARSTTLVTRCQAVTYRFKGTSDEKKTVKKKS